MSTDASGGTPAPLSYAGSGVDIDRGNDLVERIKPMVARTRRPGVLGGLGGFGALFSLSAGRYRNPVLVSSTDGVGTKLLLARELGRHEGIGVDLVAMCVNDLIVQGAEPLFFLDYFATGRLDVDTAATVIAGIARGCEEAGAALIGGETAEMPDMYPDQAYDLAGFAVGAVEHDDIIDGQRVRPGDAVIGLGSSGLHSNGFSLVRRIVARHGISLDSLLTGRSLGELLLEPTRIYVRRLSGLVREVAVHAAAHITGGGLVENPPRVLPPNVRMVIDTRAWPRPAVFDWLQRTGPVEPLEMLRTFNCGIGMLVVVPEAECERAMMHLSAVGEPAWVIGRIEAHPGAPEVRFEGL